MISLIYFLLASCFLIGCFANFAGNTYGFELVRIALAGYMLFLFTTGIIAGKKFWSKSRSAGIVVLAESWLVGFGVMGIQMKFNSLDGVGPAIVFGFGLAGLIFLFKSFGHLASLRKKENRFASFDAFQIQHFCAIALFTTISKFMHWGEIFLPLLFSAVLLFILILFSRAIHLMVKYGRKKNPAVIPGLHVPSRSLFVILSVVILHIFGSIAGWVPGFQFLERPITYTRIKEQKATQERENRLDCYNQNMTFFFDKRQLSGVAELDSTKFCLPENGK